MEARSSPHHRANRSVAGRSLLALAVFLAIAVGGRGSRSEASLSLQGDAARYLMDGVFLHDLVGSGVVGTPAVLLRYAEAYYARYPALSIGHHPPFLAVSLVPFFWVFGVSAFAARVAMVVFFVLATVLLFDVGRRLYGETTAGLACLLFASQPYVGGLGQAVLSEMPAIAVILAAFGSAVRFQVKGRTSEYVFFLGLAVLSLTTRETAVFVFPAYAITLCLNGGWRHFQQRPTLWLTILASVAFGIVAVATLLFSPYNAAVVVMLVRGLVANGLHVSTLTGPLTIIGRAEIGLPLLLVAGAGLVVSIVRRDRASLPILAWIGSVLACVLFITRNVDAARYAVLAVPAYCLAAASLWSAVGPGPKPVARTVCITVVAGAALWQLAAGRTMAPVGADGYEEAAEYVVSAGGAPTVLFSGPVDTGYFVFFVRKHDPAERLVVLRSDKLLTTSLVGNLSVEARISRPEQIYDNLREFGTRFVVIEDTPTGSTVLDWLRQEVKGNRFKERARFPTHSTDRRLRGVDVAVFEYLEAVPAATDAELDLKLPIVGREIRMPLSELARDPEGR